MQGQPTMKSFTSLSFFLLFEQIIRQDNPGLAKDGWTQHGVVWNRARHNFNGGSYGYALEIFTATRDGKDPWSFFAAKERWWGGRHDDVIKSQQWARPIRGKRASILAWFAERKRLLQK
jgi:hypothetical protein